MIRSKIKLTEQDRISIDSTKEVILGDYKGHIAEDRKQTFESIKREGIKEPIELVCENPSNDLVHNIKRGFCRMASAELLNIENVEAIYKGGLNAKNND